MLISLNEIKKLVNINISDDELLKLIGSRLVEIEGVDDWSKKFKKIYVVKVIEASPIEGTHLSLCKIDAGETLNREVDPDHENYVQVVCGAPNVRAGMFAAWIAPGAIVPATFNTPDPFEISARKLRGFMSFGMLAGADELSLGDDHSGIVELDPALRFSTILTASPNPNTPAPAKTQRLAPGQLLADVLDLNDKILEVENKSLTHRPDCFGLIGFAREIAGILGQPFNPARSGASAEKLPDSFDIAQFLKTHPEFTTTAPLLNLPIEISDSALCPRYEALVFDFKSLPKASPYLTPDDVFLYKAGMRPISPLVDATNLIMLKTGQPLHAFDYDKFTKISGQTTPEIRVRLARNDEKLTLLDEKEITLSKNDIVICSGDTPVALAGAMGGQSTEIDVTTKTIIVEIASFSLYNLRKTQMTHGLFSEAVTRFTKGRPVTDLLPALFAAINSFCNDFGAALIGSGHAARNTKTTSLKTLNEESSDHPSLPTINITVSKINAILGSAYSEELIIKTLENVNFKIEKSADTLLISAPAWRTDINIKEDIVEEIGRLLGFDNLPLSLPTRPFSAPFLDPILKLKSSLRTLLSDRLGLNEVLTYSFVSKQLQSRALEPVSDSYLIVNSISPDLECFRQSLIPSLLDKTRENKKTGHTDFALYEINQVTKKSWGLTSENVPTLKTELSLILPGDFYQVKHLFFELKRALNLDLSLKPLETDSTYFLAPHSTAIFLTPASSDTAPILVGILGELKPSVLKNFKLLEKPSEVYSALKIYLDPCAIPRPIRKLNLSLSRFPATLRDLTVKVPVSTPFSSVEANISSTLAALDYLSYTLKPTSIFRKSASAEPTKNLSFHLELKNPEKTLTSAEVSAIMEKITKNLSTLGAEVV